MPTVKGKLHDSGGVCIPILDLHSLGSAHPKSTIEPSSEGN